MEDCEYLRSLEGIIDLFDRSSYFVTDFIGNISFYKQYRDMKNSITTIINELEKGKNIFPYGTIKYENQFLTFNYPITIYDSYYDYLIQKEYTCMLKKDFKTIIFFEDLTENKTFFRSTYMENIVDESDAIIVDTYEKDENDNIVHRKEYVKKDDNLFINTQNAINNRQKVLK